MSAAKTRWNVATGRGEALLLILILASAVLSVTRWISPGFTVPDPEPLWLLIVRTVVAVLIFGWAFLPEDPSEERHTILGIPIRWFAVAIAALLAWAWFTRLRG